MNEDDDFARQVGPCVITLNEEQWADFMHNMQNPKPPTPRMIAAARMMLELSEGRYTAGNREYDSWGQP